MKLTKMTRRSLAMLLAMMMVFSLAVPAFADTGIADDTAISEEDINHNEEVIEDTADDDAIDTGDDAEEHVHNYIMVENTATCLEAGTATYICECGEEMTEPTEALGHDFIIDPNGGSSEPTCEMMGVNAYICTRCSQSNVEMIDVLGHDWETEIVEPTCTMPGQTIHRCVREGCNEVRTEVGTETDPLNHVWDEGTVTTAPTCTEEGVMTFTCTACGEAREEAVPMIEHDYTDNFEIEGTQAPTCTENGVAMSTCSVCGHAEARIIEALGHTHEESAEGVVTAATCTMQGYTTYTCDRCGESYQDDYTDMLPHVRDESTRRVITPATTTTEGVVEYTCSVCMMLFTESIPMLRPSTGGGGGGAAAATEPVEIDEPDVPLASAMPFDDVKENAWYHEAVQYVYDNDLMSGTENNAFAPNLGTTRGMIVTILHRLENKPEVTIAAAFSDVAVGKWYSDAVSWAAENEIVTGYEDGSFRPDKDITRQELAAILYRYAEYKEYDVTGRTDLSVYSDADSVASYFKDAVEWSVNADLINGMEDGTLAPANGATRAQLASILMRFDKSFTAHESDAE